MSEVFELGLTRLCVVAATEAATVIEGELQPGGGSTWHTHTLEDETIVVVEGALVVNDDERREVGPGEAHVLRRGVRHAFANETSALTRVYFICTPGGLERFFRDLVSGTPPDEAAEARGARVRLGREAPPRARLTLRRGGSGLFGMNGSCPGR